VIKLADILEALTEIRPAGAEMIVTGAAVDSRQVIPGSLFVAMPGEHVDGHDYIKDAFDRGACLALVQRDVEGEYPVLDLRQPLNPEAVIGLKPPIILRVTESLPALQQIARFWRQKLNLRVIGITGSVGKSTTKELIADVLCRRYRTLRSPGNLNNEIGLPLTILQLSSGYDHAVLEMGFYVPGEIALLCDIARPQVGVVTNIGTVHAERAGSQEIIARGKAELVQKLPPEGVAVLNFDDPWVRKMSEQTRAQVLFYGLDRQAHLWADGIQSMGLDGIRLRLHYGDEVLNIRVPLIGRHSVHTVLRAAAVGLIEGLTWNQIISGLQLGTAQLRLVAVHSTNGALLLDDTYNASPESTLAALNLLADLEGQKIAVLGDMLELGPYEKQGHQMVGLRAAQVVNRLITVGCRGRLISDAARQAGLHNSAINHFETVEEVVDYLKDHLNKGDVVLVKGSHGMRMDRIISTLEIES
jgi:UDP-N-acetylmuramoyl-tripeptide--D-alanyl-D-alanine ligase